MGTFDRSLMTNDFCGNFLLVSRRDSVKGKQTKNTKD